MIEYINNGFLVQDINKPTNYAKTFNYQGMEAYYSFPLSFVDDIECRDLTRKQETYKHSDNTYSFLEYISNDDFLLGCICDANLIKVSPVVKMLLRNKEPSVTKNQNFSRHLPSKEGRTHINIVALRESNTIANAVPKFATCNLQFNKNRPL